MAIRTLAEDYNCREPAVLFAGDVPTQDAMTLKETVREKFEPAKRGGQREEKNLLSVILGDISTAKARTGKELSDAEVEKLLRKMVESNTETLTQL